MNIAHVFCLLFWFYSSLASAQGAFVGNEEEGIGGQYSFSPFELSMMPYFCTLRKTKSNEWFNARGMHNLHHACKGLNHISHAILAKNEGEKNHNITTGIGEFQYVLNLKGLSDSFRAFLLFSQARLYVMQDSKEKAIKGFESAISLDKKLIPAYLTLAEFYTDIGKKDEAIRVVRDGLVNNPNSKGLQKLKVKLGIQ